jgi:hypothetical protein
MNQSRFEALTRQIAASSSRRTAVKALAAAFATQASMLAGNEEALAGVPIVHCKTAGFKCDSPRDCCSGRCKNQLCLCRKRRQPCWQPLEGAECCSQRCRKGRCA